MTRLNPLFQILEELRFELKDSPQLRLSNRKANHLGKNTRRRLSDKRILCLNALNTGARQAFAGLKNHACY
jgi:hypothetical protein